MKAPLNKEQVAAMKTGALVALYNQLTGKKIKKFSSRAAGEKQVLAAAAKAEAAGTTVKGSAGAKNGRPTISFSVTLTEEKAKSKPHAASARMKLIEWMRSDAVPAKEGKKTVTIEQINAHFKRKMRGVVQKLIEKKWLARSEAAA